MSPDTYNPNKTDYMKTKIITACVILLIFTIQNLSGQQAISGYNNDLTDSEPYLTGELFMPGIIADKATYFNSEWLSGDIYLSTGEVARNKLIRYNGLLDELFWQEPRSNNIIKLDKEAIVRFHFLNLNGDTSVWFRKIKFKRSILTDSSEVFGQVICDESSSLLIVHTFKKAANISSVEKVVFEEEPVYIFRFPNHKTFVTRSLKRGSLYAFSPGNKDKIKEFLKTNKTGKVADKNYLIRLTMFLSTLN